MRVISFIAALAVASSVHAEKADETAAKELITQAMDYLNIAYACQDAIGVSYFDLARERTVQAFVFLGAIGSPEAIRNSQVSAAKIVDESIEIIRRKSTEFSKAAAGKCLEELQAAQTRMDMSLLKFKIAARR